MTFSLFNYGFLVTWISLRVWKENSLNGSWWFCYERQDPFYICLLGLEVSAWKWQ